MDNSLIDQQLRRSAVSLPRRRLLRSAAFLGAAAALSPLETARGLRRAAAAASPAVQGRYHASHLRLSCAAYSFRRELNSGRMTLTDFIDFCARHRLDGTELTSYYFRQTDRAYLCELRRRAYVNGLTISGTPVGNNFCLPPGDKRDQQIRHVKEWIDHVAILGSQTIRVFAGSVPNGATESQAVDWAVAALREVASYAGERGVVLALENHGGITSTADQLLRLVRGVDSPWLGVNLDTGNFHHRPYDEIGKTARYAVSVQVKVEVRTPAGGKTGSDLQRVVEILRHANYRGFVALEYEASAPAIEAVPRHLDRLRDAIARG